MSNPFDYVTSVSYSKVNLMEGTENDELAEKDYNPYIVNKALSYHSDTIGFANEMNIRYQLSKKAQYSFFINILRPKKRYAKWSKKENDGDLSIIKECYGYNDTKARTALTILTKQQIDSIREKLDKGGKQ